MASAHICIAFGPLAVYLLLMGLINALRRPFITTGARDLFSLSLALSGLVMVGPVNLFVPHSALSVFGPWAWVLLIALYMLFSLLIGISCRPRLVIYNLSSEQLKSVLGRLVAQLDPDARWAGDSVELPNLGIQLSIDKRNAMRSCQIIAVGVEQNQANWSKLKRELATELTNVKVTTNPYAISMITVALVLGTLIAQQIIENQSLVYNQLRDLL
jgi:hypothetical protein